MVTISIFSLLSCFAFFFFHIHLSVALDSISQGQSLSGNQTLVSKGGNFELGFFTPGNSHNYYLGIWYKKVPKQTVVWVANREWPVPNASSLQLTISKDSNLVLKSSKIQIWSSNSTFPSTNSTFAILSDDGNFLLKDRLSSHILWQSFDHPTNTWLQGAKLGYNKLTGEHQFLTSWRNSEDPAPGIFSWDIDPHGASQYYILWNRTKSYWTTGTWDGQKFSMVPEMISEYVFNINYVSNINANYFTFEYTDPSLISTYVLDYTGQMNRWQWDNNTQDWVLFCSSPRDLCEVYAVCGTFGSCDNSRSLTCNCLEGFEPLSVERWNRGDTTSGCVRKTPLNCGHNDSLGGPRDGFLFIPNVDLPTSPVPLAVGGAKECEIACLHNCSCTAYSYDSGCVIWTGDLLNLKKLSTEQLNGGQSGGLYVRLAASELQKSQSRRKRGWTAAAVAGFGSGFAIIFGIVLILICRRTPVMGASVGIQGFLVPFQYKILKKATRNFSERLGRGGFGSVFKGVLPDLTIIAVKKLEGLRQGEKQFRMEISTIGMVQHINLVRLHGFCSEGDKRLLVYEYVPKGSLDSYLFGKNSTILDWKQRYQIMLGIARGLVYLHEKCRECIVHCDIKPENILLDADLCPKVADFGMAKLIGHEFSRVLTTMKGTMGYLAPEWLSGGSITPKADVYSFGLMLFEIISGRRNSDTSVDDEVYFPFRAAIKLQEGDVLCLLDERLEGEANLEELSRVCRIACWCIQDHEGARPSMGTVVQVLELVVDVNMPPVPKMLQMLLNDANVGSTTTESTFSPESTKYISCNIQAADSF